MSDAPLRVVLADDEPIARNGLSRALGDLGGVEIVASCRNGTEALESIRRRKPDVALLDIAMPAVSGVDVVRGLAEEHRPAIVFITAFDRFAIEAFELHAVDYLLKPFDHERLRVAIARVRARLSHRPQPDDAPRLSALLDVLDERSRRADHVAVKQGGRIVFLRLDDLDWCEGADNYVLLHARGQRHLVRTTMQSFATTLDASRFARIHRSYIVNLSRIHELRPRSHGEYEVRLTDGTRLTLSRRYRDAVLARTLR